MPLGGCGEFNRIFHVVIPSRSRIKLLLSADGTRSGSKPVEGDIAS
jgi:hypothetical protein